MHVRRLSKVKPVIKSIGFSGPGGQWSASVLEIAENQVNKRKSYANANRVIISPSMQKRKTKSFVGPIAPSSRNVRESFTP